jgi:hypothetical protein
VLLWSSRISAFRAAGAHAACQIPVAGQTRFGRTMAQFVTRSRPSPRTGDWKMRHLIWIALALVVIWAVARLIAGIAGVLLNLLWILAIIAFVIWLFGVLTGKRGSGTAI